MPALNLAIGKGFRFGGAIERNHANRHSHRDLEMRRSGRRNPLLLTGVIIRIDSTDLMRTRRLFEVLEMAMEDCARMPIVLFMLMVM